VLGRGGAGRVFLAEDHQEGRHVAVKMLAGTDNPRTRARFAQEIRVASTLDDPGVVRVLDGDADPQDAWIAMEWVRGPTLRDVLGDGPVPIEEAVRIGLAVARTLARLHGKGIAHRDVKPSNILLTTDGAPLLTDFGLVAFLAVEARKRLTTHAVGTPAYMAPEQSAQPLAVHDGRKLDQFALGLVLEECITGRLVDRSALAGSMLSESQPALGAVLAKAHHPEPAARYGSMDAFAADLERVQQGREVRARAPGLWFELTRWVHRHRAPLLATAATVLGLGSVAWAASTLWSLRLEAGAGGRLIAMEERAAALRADGRVDEARAMFDAFVTLPENQGKDALARAWLAQGLRDQEAPTFDAALDSLSRAFVAARHTGTRAATAAALDRTLREAGRYRAAYQLRERFPEAVEAVDPVPLMLEAGDYDRVLAVLDPADRRAVLVDRLQRATELPARVRHTGDLDGGGLDDDMFLEVEHPLGMPLEGLPVRQIMDGEVMPVHGSSFWLGATADGGLLERTSDGTLSARCAFDGRGLEPAAVSDDAVWLLDHGQDKGVVRVDLGSCRRDRPFPDLSGSYPLDMDLADLDGDGQPEALVSVGPPDGHGVWVMGPTEAGWVERGHLRLGYLSTVRVLETAHGQRVVATSTHFHPNPKLFPEPPHLGAPAGQHILRWTGDELVVVDSLLSRRVRDTRERQWVSTWFGHVDDDGFEDIVTGDGYVYLSTPEAETPFERVPTGLESLDFIVDLDGDGRVELGATIDDRTLVLGLGERLATPPATADLDDVGEPALDGARALERIGLTRYAAEAYARIGRGRTDPLATDALVRAAELLGDDRPEAAAEAAEEAANRGRQELVPVAVRRYLEALRPEDAQRVLAAHDVADEARLQAQVDALTNRTSLLEPSAGARSGELLRYGPGRIEVESVMGAGPILQIPLEQTAEVVGVHVSLWTDDMEFGSQLDLRLSNGAGQPLSMQLVQRERGGTLFRFVGEIGWGKEVELSGWHEPTRFDVRIQELPESTWVAVAVWRDGELLQRRKVPRNRGTEADWLLELVAPQVSGLEGQLATVVLERLDVLGLRPVERPVPFGFHGLDDDPALLASDPTGRALLHRRLRRDPLLLRELEEALGVDGARELAAEAFAGLGEDASGLLPLLAELDPVELATRSPGLARIRAELLCRVGRRGAGLEGLEALGPDAPCDPVGPGRACFPQLPADCGVRGGP